jgi:hypothetical protein
MSHEYTMEEICPPDCVENAHQMSTSAPDQLIIREYPFLFWLLGGGSILVGLLAALRDGHLSGLLYFLIGAGLILFLAPIVTVTVDKMHGTLSIQRRTLLRNQVREIQLHDIATIQADSMISRTRGGGYRRAFRLELVLVSGEKIPLQGYYTGGPFAFLDDKEWKAQILREFIGLSASAADTTENIVG